MAPDALLNAESVCWTMNTKLAPIDEGGNDFGDKSNSRPNIEGATNAEGEAVNARQVRWCILKLAGLADQAATSQGNRRHAIELDIPRDTFGKYHFEIRGEIL